MTKEAGSFKIDITIRNRENQVQKSELNLLTFPFLYLNFYLDGMFVFTVYKGERRGGKQK